jgi:hypothetical protein
MNVDYLYKAPGPGLSINVKIAEEYIDLIFISAGKPYYQYRIHHPDPMQLTMLLASNEFDIMPKCWQREPYRGKIMDACRHLMHLDDEPTAHQRAFGILGKILSLRDLAKPKG